MFQTRETLGRCRTLNGFFVAGAGFEPATLLLPGVATSNPTRGIAFTRWSDEVRESGDGTQWYKTLPVSFSNAQAPLDAWGGLRRTDTSRSPATPRGLGRLISAHMRAAIVPKM